MVINSSKRIGVGEGKPGLPAATNQDTVASDLERRIVDLDSSLTDEISLHRFSRCDGNLGRLESCFESSI